VGGSGVSPFGRLPSRPRWGAGAPGQSINAPSPVIPAPLPLLLLPLPAPLWRCTHACPGTYAFWTPLPPARPPGTGGGEVHAPQSACGTPFFMGIPRSGCRAPTRPAGSLSGIQRGGGLSTRRGQVPPGAEAPLSPFIPPPGPSPGPGKEIPPGASGETALRDPPQEGPADTSRGPQAYGRSGDPSGHRPGSAAHTDNARSGAPPRRTSGSSFPVNPGGTPPPEVPPRQAAMALGPPLFEGDSHSGPS